MTYTYNETLQEKTKAFSIRVNLFCRKSKIHIYNKHIILQVLRSSSSVGANYTEANDALGFKDSLFRMRICRKEAKETVFWLEQLAQTDGTSEELTSLIETATGLVRIFSTIIRNKKQ